MILQIHWECMRAFGRFRADVSAAVLGMMKRTVDASAVRVQFQQNDRLFALPLFQLCEVIAGNVFFIDETLQAPLLFLDLLFNKCGLLKTVVDESPHRIVQNTENDPADQQRHCQ